MVGNEKGMFVPTNFSSWKCALQPPHHIHCWETHSHSPDVKVLSVLLSNRTSSS